MKRNQFGGTLGGPIVRDRMFVFAGYQGTTTRQSPLDQTAFVNNRIALADISPAALAISRKLPTPIDECGKVFWGSPVHENEHQIPVRVDIQASQRQSLFFRYMLTTDNRQVPYDLAGGNPLVTSQPGSDDRAHSFTAGHTWVISPTMVNSFRVLGNDVYAQKPGAKFLNLQDVGINAYTYIPGYVRLIVNGGFSLGAGSFTSNVYTKIRSYGVSDDLTRVRGSHQFAFGGHYLWGKSDMVANAWSPGSYQFTSQFTGNGIADFFTGKVAQHRQGSENPIQVTQPFVGVYTQDVWKLDRVTLNYGVVWNPYLPLDFDDGNIYNFNREKFLAGVRSTVLPTAPPGFSYPGDPGFNGNSGVNRHLNTWEPRVGFAWDVTGGGRTAVRAGAGIAHDYVTHTLHANTSTSSPFRLTVNLPPGVSLDNPWANYPGGNPFPYNYNPNNPQFPAYSSFLPLPPDLKPTTQYSWNAGVQHQITSQWFAAATYVGTKIVNMISAEEQNPALFFPGNCEAGQYGLTAPGPCSTAANLNFRRALNLANPSVKLGYITQYADVAYQNYHGMLLTSRLDVGRYLNFNVNYTLSKCEGVPATGLLNTGSNHIHQPYQNNGSTDITLDEGPCGADRRHVANLTSVFRMPSVTNGVLSAIVSDWTVSSVIQMRSGGPVNVIAGSDVALNGFTDNAPTQRPNVVPGVDPYGNRDGLTGYYNIAAFSQPASGTLGDASLNMLVGPAFWQWDQAFSRGFEVGRGRRLEVRAEGINITNHFNRGNPGATLSNAATFGRITSQAIGATPRVWQFAIKYGF